MKRISWDKLISINVEDKMAKTLFSNSQQLKNFKIKHAGYF